MMRGLGGLMRERRTIEMGLRNLVMDEKIKEVRGWVERK